MLSRLGIDFHCPIDRTQLKKDLLIFGGVMALNSTRPMAGAAILGGYAISFFATSYLTTHPDAVASLSGTKRVVKNLADAISLNPRAYFVVASLGYVAMALRA